MTLQPGQVYQFKVLDIDENYERFQGNTGLKYCHRFAMELQEQEYDCQVCNDQSRQNFCEIGDRVEAKVSKFTKGQYTLENILVLDYKRDEPVKKAPAPTNALLRGSAAEIALQLAVEYTIKASHIPGLDFASVEQVLETADKMYGWLLKKNQPN